MAAAEDLPQKQLSQLFSVSPEYPKGDSRISVVGQDFEI